MTRSHPSVVQSRLDNFAKQRPPNMSNLPLFRDPWAKREAWRKHPVFSNRAMFRNLFPGFGIGVIISVGIADNQYTPEWSTLYSHAHTINDRCPIPFQLFFFS
ncbi:putative NADH-ubiquinone oxidoreductase B12 subunit family protein [Lyophyllum shimeji]|uniref:NADH-ubiquinone oxidoreductase B12 subunit family protein n=1 Tax=Lyophyllum shimeji TaxID=47721 RepID=A0A9P3PK86_LYOSH|nr:putative NADH-ubiquinone oxidoreductase B12 subunit family protein [Lyophyllum shimeji]